MNATVIQRKTLKKEKTKKEGMEGLFPY